MDLSQKPFVCNGQGCKKEFTTEDHLNVHMKKHKLALDCNGDCQNVSGADQTPTPTRFIRNCEELGLFQDLQNVNPFDETFCKATKHVKCGKEPLQTPQILSQKVLGHSEKRMKLHSDDNSDDSKNLKIIGTDDQNYLEQRLKLERIREINRASQIRSRAKKKLKFNQLSEEIIKLNRDKKNLFKENKYLKRQIIFLQTLLSYHEDCSVSRTDPTITDKVNTLIGKSKEKLKKDSGLVMNSNNKVYKPIFPNNNTKPGSLLLLQHNSPTLPTASQVDGQKMSEVKHVINPNSGNTTMKSLDNVNQIPHTNWKRIPVFDRDLCIVSPPLIVYYPPLDSDKNECIAEQHKIVGRGISKQGL